MFAYRRILLAATISSVSVVLADVLVQPGYHYDNNRHNPPYQPAVSQHQPLLPTERYYTKQPADQQSMQHLKGIQIIYPYWRYYDYDQPHFVGHPVYRRNYPVLPHRLHFTKIGGRKYIRPSIFVGYPQPMIGHHRFRRSLVHDATVEKVGKSTIVKHDDGVATKPSLMTAKYLTAIDSHLQKNQPISTDDNHSAEKRQSKDDRTTKGPLLFGLFPENMYRGSRHLNADSNPVTRSPQANSAGNMLKYPGDKSTANLATTIIINPMEKAISGTSQETGRGQEDNKDQQQNQTPLTDTKQPSIPTPTSSSNKTSDEESAMIGASPYYDPMHGKELEWPITSSEIYIPMGYDTWSLTGLYHTPYMRNFPDPRPGPASWKFEPRYQQNAHQATTKKPSLRSRSKLKERLKTNHLIGASNPDSDYRTAIPCNSPSYPEYPFIYDIPPEVPNTYEPIVVSYPIDPNYNYAIYRYSDAQSNPTPITDVQTAPYVSRMVQFPNTYNNPVNTRYIALPQTYYHLNSALTHDSAPFEGTFSSPTYY
ncbi:PREDICTED: uncharacterized protein LOC106745446 [Dinoponera quadriceps]|uniref:Uncharacterized protein LOC106745446 n=1 Tax=Dinoponera quadriceps TaxID=609295 RepID=A0A6P3XEE1_DINQU|nr:PREDICTED: uncharacterized protein LOC106745446 [Dinoponera quadriceps]